MKSIVLLLEGLQRLPFEIVIRICEYLPRTYIIDCFIWLTESRLRDAVISEYFQDKLILDYSQKKVPTELVEQMDSMYMCKDSFTIYGKKLIEEFLDFNQDIHFRKLTLKMGSKKKSDHLQMDKIYKINSMGKIDRISLVMNGSPDRPLSVLFDNLPNVYELSTFKDTRMFYQTDILLQWPNLNSFKAEYSTIAWSQINFPLSLKTLNIVGFPKTNFAGFRFPESIETLIMVAEGGQRFCLKFPMDILPLNLKSLKLVDFGIVNFYIGKLSQSLILIDVTHNYIEDFGMRIGFLTSISWPPLLERIGLTYSNINNQTIKQLDLIGWSDGLRLLDLTGNRFSSLSFVNCLPQSLSDLNLSRCCLNFEFFSDPLKFPNSLTKLSMQKCHIKSLNLLEFPPLVEEIYLDFNEIKDLNGSFIRWTHLSRLKIISLASNQISTILTWSPPNSLQVLNLHNNLITEVCATILFNQGQNTKYSNLRSIDLGQNKIAYIDKHASVPRNVNKLNFASNPLDLVPLNSAFFTKNLNELILEDTKVSWLGFQGNSPRILIKYLESLNTTEDKVL